MAERRQYGDWLTLDRLGEGGQGEVFKARKISSDSQTERIINSITKVASITYANEKARAAEELIAAIRAVVAEGSAPLGALKVLHDSAGTDAKSSHRLEQELDALGKVDHPSLVRVYDQNLQERWFVMEFFERKTLHDHIEETRGDLLASLTRIRPLVEAVSLLHTTGLVHRDIKPGNVFVADDGHLVLGDFGLTIDPSSPKSRITDTYENVGSRDWMPAWAMGMRLDAVRPSFDVFGLGKLLWFMVSGKQILPLWYHHEEQFELERMFPRDRSMLWARTILDRCIVEREDGCIKDAGALLTEIDALIGALKRSGQVMSRNRSLICNCCGLGTCNSVVRDDPSSLILACDRCGYAHTFIGADMRPAWK